jgi:hypothetical protein
MIVGSTMQMFITIDTKITQKLIVKAWYFVLARVEKRKAIAM